jgi:hypothetical protein
MEHPWMNHMNQCHSSKNQLVMEPKTILDIITEETW